MRRSERRSLTRQARSYFQDMKVPRWRKLAGLGALVYLFSPVDVVPDVIPLVGWLDDVGVVSAVAMFLYRDIQRHRPPHEGTRPGEQGP
jgi:uncharacterized membrane protein YkvA (DUF1232 family)